MREAWRTRGDSSSVLLSNTIKFSNDFHLTRLRHKNNKIKDKPCMTSIWRRINPDFAVISMRWKSLLKINFKTVNAVL